jgi:penicillin-insensitive murein endopeptidase
MIEMGKPMISFLRTATRLAAVALAAFALSGTVLPRANAEQLAKDLFGNVALPAATAARSYGFYSKGCFSGGMAIAADGPTWQAMRLSRNRRWGHPTMIALVEKLSRDATADGWPGLLIGDISQPRGGPMLTGHASHQIGLDADIWLTPMPNRRLSAAERENLSAVSMIKKNGLTVNEKVWTPAHARLLKRAASYPEVERILVHPGIKKKLCDTVTGDRSWLRKVRPFWGHDYHFHIRIGCQPGSTGCKPQPVTAAGDGCDKSLAWWFTEEPWRPNKNPDAPKARDLMKLSSLPKECRAVLNAPSPVSEAAVTYRGQGSSVAVAIAPSPGAMPEITADPAALPAAASAFFPTPETGVPLPRPRPSN